MSDNDVDKVDLHVHIFPKKENLDVFYLNITNKSQKYLNGF